MKTIICFLIISLMILSSCSSDNESPLPEEPIDVPVVGVYDEENRWIYGQMNHYYLWRNDLPDSLSCDYTVDPVSFYKALLSPKDCFSYCVRNTSYEGPTEKNDYGFAYQVYVADNAERLLQVLYVTSEELKGKLHRGEWLKEISTQGNIKVFELGNFQNGKFHSKTTLVLTGRAINSQPNTVYKDSIYTVFNKKVGYLCYLEFDKISDLVAPLRNFYQSNIDELVLDLRYNPGGYVNTCRYLCNSIISEIGYGQIFQQCKYNDRLSEEIKKETGYSMTIEYYDIPTNEEFLGTALYGLNLKRIYVLTSQYTASASEAAIVCLKPYMDVIVIGEQTYGKGVGSITLSESRFKYMLQPIIMQYYNSLMETVPNDGIPVDILIAGGYHTLKKNLGDIDEPLLAAAIKHIENGVVVNSITDVNEGRSLKSDLTPVGVPSFFQKTITEY